MDKRIDAFADLFLKDLPYSERIEKASRDIRRALAEKAEEMPFEELVAKYGSLEKLSALAGIDAAEAASWRAETDIIDERDIMRTFRRQRRIWIAAAFCVMLAFDEFLWSLHNVFYSHADVAVTAAISALFVGIFSLLLRKVRRTENERPNSRITADAFRQLRTLSDVYTKRTLHSLALLFAGAGVLIAFGISFYYLGNSKSAELLESLMENSNLVLIPLFLLTKNALCLRALQRRIELPDRRQFRQYCRGLALFSLIFWTAVDAVLYFLRERIARPINVSISAAVLFGVMILCFDLTLRQRLTYQNLVFNRRKVALWTGMAVLVGGFTLLRRETWYTQPYINSVPVVKRTAAPIAYDEDTGVYTITADGDFRIKIGRAHV